MKVYLLMEWSSATRETRVVQVFRNRNNAEKMLKQHENKKDVFFENYFIDEWVVD